jgi:hypothetical protein
MTPKEILDIVREKADTRLDETVEKLLAILRNRHTHQCWQRECSCEYCQFINGQYVDLKLSMHRLKVRINRIDYWDARDWEMTLLPQLSMDMMKLKEKLRTLKAHKKDLQTNIV